MDAHQHTKTRWASCGCIAGRMVSVGQQVTHGAAEDAAHAQTQPRPPIAPCSPCHERPCTHVRESKQPHGCGRPDLTVDARIRTYEWFRGNVRLGEGIRLNVSLEIGTHAITLRVTDDRSVVDMDSMTIEVSGRPRRR